MHQQSVLITGAGRGLGLELAVQSVQRGNLTHVTVRDPVKAERLIALMSAYPTLLQVHQVDVTNLRQIKVLTSHFHNRPIDLVINNAGVIGDSTLIDFDFEKSQAIMNTNLYGPIRITQALLNSLLLAEQPKVVFISSSLASIHNTNKGGRIDYKASKAALNMLSKCISVEYPTLVSLAVDPGWIATDMGGPNAPLSPVESAIKIIKICETADLRMSGKYVDLDGNVIPW